MKLQFVRSNNIVSDFIAWYSHGLYSHVDAVMPDGSLLGARLDSFKIDGKEIRPGVQIRPANYETWSRICQVDLTPKTQEQPAEWEAWLRSKVGYGYDEKAIWGFLFDENKTQADSYMCSELQTAALIACGYLPNTLTNPTYKVTPDDLLFLLSAFEKVNIIK